MPTAFYLRKTEIHASFPESRNPDGQPESELRRNVSKQRENFYLDSP
jgi:hypothetical protein